VIKGHVVKDCWYSESNRDKRLAEFKVNSDRRNSEEVAARIKVVTIIFKNTWMIPLLLVQIKIEQKE
jgi:hypothetical protein